MSDDATLVRWHGGLTIMHTEVRHEDRWTVFGHRMNGGEFVESGRCQLLPVEPTPLGWRVAYAVSPALPIIGAIVGAFAGVGLLRLFQ